MGRVVLIILILSSFLVELKAQSKCTVSLLNGDGGELQRTIENNLGNLLSELNLAFAGKRNIKFPPSVTSTNAQLRINALWQTSAFRCGEIELRCNLLRLPDGGFQVRNIPFQIPGRPAEEGVVNISATGQVEDIYFGVPEQNYKMWMNKATDLKEFRRRQVVLDFLENFRTAYNRKDLDMLQKTFSDNALIIVGHVLRDKPEKEQILNSLGAKRVELIRYNKQQYLTQLTLSFKRNQFIDVRFSDIEMVKHPGHANIYGVNLKQVWRSSTYGDEGYLFLMIDFDDEAHPLIHVRAWQPQKDTGKDDVIQLGDFDIVK